MPAGTTMPSDTPRVLVLDNSPRRLGTRWFRHWFDGVLGVPVSAYHVIAGSRVRSLDGFDLLVISGSPASATDEEDWIHHELELIEEADRREMPTLGVCFGSQLLGRAYYGKDAIRRSSDPEFGWHRVERVGVDPLFEGVPDEFITFQYHMEEVIPQPDMKRLACNQAVELQGFRCGSKPIWGLQFHLEVTPQAGRDLLRRTQKVYQPYGFSYDGLTQHVQRNIASERIFRNFVRIWGDAR